MATPGHQYNQPMMSQPSSTQQFPTGSGMMGGLQQGIMGGQGQPQGMMGQHQSPMQQQVSQIMSPTKEVNSITICRKGQECAQDIYHKVLDIFKLLQTKSNPLPNGVTIIAQMHQERRAKIDEQLTQLSLLFKKLRCFYDKINEICPDETQDEGLVPYVGQPQEDRLTQSSDSYYRSKFVLEENKEITEQLTMKNRQLKAIIDQMRTIIWEINTMIVMRKT